MTLTARVSLGVVGFVLVLLFIPQASSAATMEVSIGANYFAPSQITVNVGDTVTWRNADTVAHTVTAYDGAFDSGTLQPGAVFSRTFTTPGTYSYRCVFHPGMVGTISVVASGQPQTYTQTYGTPQSLPLYYAPAQSSGGSPTADQLRAQAQALIARIQQLQTQLGSPGIVSVPRGGDEGVALYSSSCPLIGRSLRNGSRGEDVTRLQQFLARDPEVYPESRVTGYYGALTEAAVRRWQAKYNIVSSGTPDSTGYGIVGPRTAAAIALLCTTGSYGGIPGPGGGTSSPVGGFIQVTPVTGNAPLSVAVQATVNTVNSCSGAAYVLDYGDGSQPVQVVVPVGNCQQMVQVLAHEYRYGGTYLMTLSSGGHRTSATVTVYGPGIPTPTPTPPAGPRTWGIVSVTPAVGGDPFSASVEIEYPSCAAYSVDWGDSSIPSSTPSQSGCSGGSSRATVSHTYGMGGSYTISLRDGSGGVKATAGVTII